MSEDRDDRIAEFLREQAPPARDAAFRVRVLERREQRRFQRTSFTILAGALMIVLLLGFGVDMGGVALQNTAALAVGTALGSAWLAFRGRLRWVIRRFSL